MIRPIRLFHDPPYPAFSDQKCSESLSLGNWISAAYAMTSFVTDSAVMLLTTN